MERKSIIELDNICKSFSENGVWQHVLKNLSVNIYDGDFTVIMGASGEGKTTLMRILIGMETVNLGSVKILGEEINKFSEERRSELRGREFGYMSQKQEFLEHFSIYENILIQNIVGRKNEKIKERMKVLIENMQIDKRILDKRPGQLSCGELSRCSLVKALVGAPKILFMDEPTGKLNHSQSEFILNKLNELNREGQSIVMVTHDVYAAIRANRVLYLSEGKINDEIVLPPWYIEKDDSGRRHKLVEFLERYGW